MLRCSIAFLQTKSFCDTHVTGQLYRKRINLSNSNQSLEPQSIFLNGHQQHSLPKKPSLRPHFVHLEAYSTRSHMAVALDPIMPTFSSKAEEPPRVLSSTGAMCSTAHDNLRQRRRQRRSVVVHDPVSLGRSNSVMVRRTEGSAVSLRARTRSWRPRASRTGRGVKCQYDDRSGKNIVTITSRIRLLVHKKKD